MMYRNESYRGFNASFLDMTSMILEERGDPLLNKVDFALLNFGGYRTALAVTKSYKPGPVFEKTPVAYQEQV